MGRLRGGSGRRGSRVGVTHLATAAIERVGRQGDGPCHKIGLEEEPAVVQESVDSIIAGLLIGAEVLHRGDRTGLAGEATHLRGMSALQGGGGGGVWRGRIARLREDVDAAGQGSGMTGGRIAVGQQSMDTEGETGAGQGNKKTEGRTGAVQGSEKTEGGTEAGQGSEKTEGGTEADQGNEKTEGGTEAGQGNKKTEGGTEAGQGSERTGGGTEAGQGSGRTEGGRRAGQRSTPDTGRGLLSVHIAPSTEQDSSTRPN